MNFLLTFIEGLMSFISPCVLPLIPLYVFYFAGGQTEESLPEPKGGESAKAKEESAKTTGGESAIVGETAEAKAEAKSAASGEISAATLDIQNAATLDKQSAATADRQSAAILDKQSAAAKKKVITIINALGFVLGFAVIFVVSGVFAGSLGMWLIKYRNEVNIVSGAVVVLFGLNYLGVLRLKFLSRTIKPEARLRPDGFLKAVLFGVIFAVGWSPCTGAFLGSALMLAASSQSRLIGTALLGAYSLGLGIPFILCAALIGRLKGVFKAVKKHYKVINIVCGVLLCATGVLMMTGLMTKINMLFS